MSPNEPGSGGDTRVVVLGASGMLGSALLSELATQGVNVRGTVRQASELPASFLARCQDNLIDGVDVHDDSSRHQAMSEADVVVNAVGVIKQASSLEEDPVGTVRTNALLPHLLAAECDARGIRLVHVSTDCVFSGRAGGYSEEDVPDPIDLYGRSKLLGEVSGQALTLRTSIIGHELQRHASLLDWFIAQPETSVRGFVNAIYSGITTHEFARLLATVVIPNPGIRGLYHVASEPISKFELLRLLANVYGWRGLVEPESNFACDRSMRADRLEEATGYRAPQWPDMISDMYKARPMWALAPGVKELRA